MKERACRIARIAVACAALSTVIAAPVWSGSHTWDVREIFSNADGTIQFIRMEEMNGTAGEIFLSGLTVSSNSNVFTFPGNLVSPSSNKHLLLATTGFQALVGAPAADYTIVDNFFSTTADSIAYHTYDTTAFTAGQLPTDGVNSFFKGGSTGAATPRNYAGAAFAPAGVQNLLVDKITNNGARLALSWDDQSCLGHADHHIVTGLGSMLPTTLGGTYMLLVCSPSHCCDIGSSPYNWLSGVPNPASGEFAWFLVVADDDLTASASDGPWGEHSGGADRIGPGSGGSSMPFCSVTGKTLTNTCGQ